MQYRRADIKDGTYFFTVNLADRKSNLLIERIDDLREVMKNVKQRHPFQIDAMVVLPEHLHAIWTLPQQQGQVQNQRSNSNAATGSGPESTTQQQGQVQNQEYEFFILDLTPMSLWT